MYCVHTPSRPVDGAPTASCSWHLQSAEWNGNGGRAAACVGACVQTYLGVSCQDRMGTETLGRTDWVRPQRGAKTARGKKSCPRPKCVHGSTRQQPAARASGGDRAASGSSHARATLAKPQAVSLSRLRTPTPASPRWVSSGGVSMLRPGRARRQSPRLREQSPGGH